MLYLGADRNLVARRGLSVMAGGSFMAARPLGLPGSGLHPTLVETTATQLSVFVSFLFNLILSGQMLAHNSRRCWQPQFVNTSVAIVSFRYTTQTRPAEIWHFCSALSCQGRCPMVSTCGKQAGGSEMKEESHADMFLQTKDSCELM